MRAVKGASREEKQKKTSKPTDNSEVGKTAATDHWSVEEKRSCWFVLLSEKCRMEAMAGGMIGEETADGGEERRADKQDFIF